MFSTIVRNSLKTTIAGTRFLSTSNGHVGRYAGTVKWFDHKKGYGFLDGGDGQDVFVHQSEIQSDGFRSLLENEPVEFDMTVDEARGGKKTALKVTGPNGVPFPAERLQRARDDQRFRGGDRRPRDEHRSRDSRRG